MQMMQQKKYSKGKIVTLIGSKLQKVLYNTTKLHIFTGPNEQWKTTTALYQNTVWDDTRFHTENIWENISKNIHVLIYSYR